MFRIIFDTFSWWSSLRRLNGKFLSHFHQLFKFVANKDEQNVKSLKNISLDFNPHLVFDKLASTLYINNGFFALPTKLKSESDRCKFFMKNPGKCDLFEN